MESKEHIIKILETGKPSGKTFSSGEVSLDLLIHHTRVSLTNQEVTKIICRSESPYRDLLIADRIKKKTKKPVSSRFDKLLENQGLEYAVEIYHKNAKAKENKTETKTEIKPLHPEIEILSGIIADLFKNEEVAVRIPKSRNLDDLKSLVIADSYLSFAQTDNKYRTAVDFLVSPTFEYKNKQEALKDLTEKIAYHEKSVQAASKYVTFLTKSMRKLKLHNIEDKEKLVAKLDKVDKHIVTCQELEENSIVEEMEELKTRAQRLILGYNSQLGKKRKSLTTQNDEGKHLIQEMKGLFNVEDLNQATEDYLQVRKRIADYSKKIKKPEDRALKKDYEELTATLKGLAEVSKTERILGRNFIIAKIGSIEERLQTLTGEYYTEVQSLEQGVEEAKTLLSSHKRLGGKKSIDQFLEVSNQKIKIYQNKEKVVEKSEEKIDKLRVGLSKLKAEKILTKEYMTADQTAREQILNEDKKLEGIIIDDNLSSRYNRLIEKRDSIIDILDKNNSRAREHLSKRLSEAEEYATNITIVSGDKYREMEEYSKELSSLTPYVEYFYPSGKDKGQHSLSVMALKGENYQQVKKARLQEIDSFRRKIITLETSLVKSFQEDEILAETIDDYQQQSGGYKNHYRKKISSWKQDCDLIETVDDLEELVSSIELNLDIQLNRRGEKLYQRWGSYLAKWESCNKTTKQGIDRLKSVQNNLESVLGEANLLLQYYSDDDLKKIPSVTAHHKKKTEEEIHRYRKLREKNISTLDFAAEYIKELQGNVKELPQAKSKEQENKSDEKDFSAYFTIYKEVFNCISENLSYKQDEGLSEHTYFRSERIICTDIADQVNSWLGVMNKELSDHRRKITSSKIETQQDVKRAEGYLPYANRTLKNLAKVQEGYMDPFLTPQLRQKCSEVSQAVFENKVLITKADNSYQKIKTKRIKEINSVKSDISQHRKNNRQRKTEIKKKSLKEYAGDMGIAEKLFDRAKRTYVYRYDEGIIPQLRKFHPEFYKFCQEGVKSINQVTGDLTSLLNYARQDLKRIKDSSRWYKLTTVESIGPKKRISKYSSLLEIVRPLDQLKRRLMTVSKAL